MISCSQLLFTTFPKKEVCCIKKPDFAVLSNGGETSPQRFLQSGVSQIYLEAREQYLEWYFQAGGYSEGHDVINRSPWVSQTQASFILCLRLIYLDVFVFFIPVPLLDLVPVRLRTWYIFPLSVVLSLSLPLLFFFFFTAASSLPLTLRPFLFHNKPLTPLRHCCLLCTMDFLPFHFRFPAAEYYYMSEQVSVWAVSGISRTQMYTHTHTHTPPCTCWNTHMHAHKHIFSCPEAATLYTHLTTHVLDAHTCVHTASPEKVLQIEPCHWVIYVSLPFQSMIKAFNKLRGVAPQTWYLINLVSHIYQRRGCSISPSDITASQFEGTRKFGVYLFLRCLKREEKVHFLPARF